MASYIFTLQHTTNGTNECVQTGIWKCWFCKGYISAFDLFRKKCDDIIGEPFPPVTQLYALFLNT